MSEILKTYNSNLKTLRDMANQDASPLAITTAGNYAGKPASAVSVNSDDDESLANGVQIQIFGGDAADDNFTWLLYGWRKDNGIATLICSGTGILGTMQVVTYPNKVGTGASEGKGDTATSKFWADTLVITTNSFVKTWAVTDSGTNRAAILSGDLAGFTDLYLEIQDADGTSTEAEDVGAFYAGW